MHCSNQDKPLKQGISSGPSRSFGTSSTASATSAYSSRSGGSKLLFGEIDASSHRTSELDASVCSLVQCGSSAFLEFWLDDRCRESFLNHVPKDGLAKLRLICHSFGVRAAPALFNDLVITFGATTFTKPARLEALHRMGFFVTNLTIRFPHSAETFLPPLVEPETGQQLHFTYTPLVEGPTSRRPKYGDHRTTMILARQWPTIFHAATNVPAFVQAFSSFVNLSHLIVSCPDFNTRQRYRRSVVDYALTSLRIAVEKNRLNALRTLTLSPIHPQGLLYMSPIIGGGTTPRSTLCWGRIHHLTIHAFSLEPCTQPTMDEPEYFKILQTYVRSFQSNLITFNFRWIGPKGRMPLQGELLTKTSAHRHNPGTPVPQKISRHRRCTSTVLHFPKLRRAVLANFRAEAGEVAAFTASHQRTITELNFGDVDLIRGTWDQALDPLTKLDHCARHQAHETGNTFVPIILSPTLSADVERGELLQYLSERKSL